MHECILLCIVFNAFDRNVLPIYMYVMYNYSMPYIRLGHPLGQPSLYPAATPDSMTVVVLPSSLYGWSPVHTGVIYVCIYSTHFIIIYTNKHSDACAEYTDMKTSTSTSYRRCTPGANEVFVLVDGQKNSTSTWCCCRWSRPSRSLIARSGK